MKSQQNSKLLSVSLSNRISFYEFDRSACICGTSFVLLAFWYRLIIIFVSIYLLGFFPFMLEISVAEVKHLS